MDVSKNYIKKCEKAYEIKSFWEPKNGDYFYGVPEDFADLELEKGVYQYFECEDEYYSIIPKDYDIKKKAFKDFTDCIHLPSQSNLQGMLFYESSFDLINDFYKWTSELTIDFQERFRTMEQLWLGFVMCKKYNKIWTGKDWIDNI